MKNRTTSTVGFFSNLQPISQKNNLDDRKFMSHVHDPFNLEKLEKSGTYHLSELQQREYEQTSMHCAYAYADDYPFGTVIAEDGKRKVVCKCLKTDCPLFSRCRPDFKQEELSVLQENQSAAADIKDFLLSSAAADGHAAVKNDKAAPSEVLNRRNADIRKAESDGHSSQENDKDAISGLLREKNADDERAAETADRSSGEIGKEILEELFEILIAVYEINSESKNTDSVSETEEPKTDEDFSRNGEKARSDAVPEIHFSSFKTVDQGTVIESSPEERILVNAGPGTGKTYTLIERIRYLLSSGSAEPDNILVLCFSRAAVRVIQCRFEALEKAGETPAGWRSVDIRTFDSFATYLISWVVENKPEMLPDNYHISAENYEERISTAINLINGIPDLFTGYQQIMVDEVQDLVGNRARLVLSLLKSLPEDCGFTLSGDSCQSLYDYLAQNDSGIMSSAEFYESLFHEYRNCRFYSLSENHRQKDSLAAAILPYRNAILSGDPVRCEAEAEKLNEKIQMTRANLKHFTSDDEKEYSKRGTLGILTRTNAQALQISAWLRNEKIRHDLQRPAEEHYPAEWISVTLSDAESDVIDEREFTDLFMSLYRLTAETAHRYWMALISGETDNSKNHHNIADILSGILHNGRNALLYEDPGEETAEITVSNIHRAKGKEFDSVIVLSDVIDPTAVYNGEVSDSQKLFEDKVCYVALTRAKHNIEKAEISKQDKYIYVSKDGSRRCYRAGLYKKYISHFEVGHAGDIDESSFADSADTQEYIRNKVKAGERLNLIKCRQGFREYTAYRIVPEDDEDVTLGYTSGLFASAMISALQRIFNNYYSDLNKYLPDRLSDVYVDHKITCVSECDKLPGSKPFGNIQMWTGISISGFAHAEKDRY